MNKIIGKLEEQGHGQEVIFNEIEDLKSHFNLGKKNWFQLLKGKLFDLMGANILDKAVGEQLYKGFSEGFEEGINLIGNSI